MRLPFVSDAKKDRAHVGSDDRGSWSDDHDSIGSEEVQTGVKRIEAISLTWSKWALIVAYCGILLMAISTSLEGQTTASLSVYATSAFSEHSLYAAVLIVNGIVNAVIKPPMAKVADVFGRLEAFSIAVFLYIIGYIQMAASQNVQTFAAAQIFYSAGNTGLQILQQIFIADTSNLLNRALWSTLPDIPFLATVWIGPPVASSILTTSTWRWGYGLWTIVLPVAFLPLAIALFVNSRKAARLGLLPPAPWKGTSKGRFLRNLWFDLDVMGLIWLSAALALILLPLSLAASAKNGWKNGSMIAMVVVGVVCACIFPFWERSKRFAPTPFITLHLLKNRTVLAGCAIAFFYFMVFYLSVFPYFNSYLQVVQNDSVTAAGHITNTFTFTSTVASIGISFVIKYTAHYKYFITLGACIYLMAIGLMIRYRTETSSTSQIVGTQIALGIGGGMVNVPAQLGVQASSSHQEVAAATAIFLTVLEIGGAVGSAISGAVWTANIPKKLALYLPASAQGDAAKIFGDLATASSYALGSPERIAINRAYQETMTILLTIAVCIAAPLIPLSLLMKNYKLDQMDQRVKGKVIGTAREENLGDAPDRLPEHEQTI
ncbi:MAG: Nuclear import receptor [Chaenotheca gracillima]|nr:MAG: Nuclear import receptor [Chaenotheca gracillima]